MAGGGREKFLYHDCTPCMTTYIYVHTVLRLRLWQASEDSMHVQCAVGTYTYMYNVVGNIANRRLEYEHLSDGKTFGHLDK